MDNENQTLNNSKMVNESEINNDIEKETNKLKFKHTIRISKILLVLSLLPLLLLIFLFVNFIWTSFTGDSKIGLVVVFTVNLQFGLFGIIPAIPMLIISIVWLIIGISKSNYIIKFLITNIVLNGLTIVLYILPLLLIGIIK